MYKIKKILEKYELKPSRYEKRGKVSIVDTDKGKYVIKEAKQKNLDIYRYLNSRSFDYYPRTITDDDYQITEFIESVGLPKEQKILDLIDLVSLLHNKTTHYKEIDVDYYKKIYEDINNNIEYLYGYYNDIMDLIENNEYMSPAHYLLARNISKIYQSLYFCRTEVKKWYELIKNKKKQRLVVLHNNLELDHFLIEDKPYLINWDKSKIGIPIFDLYKLYRKHSFEIDFSSVLELYEKKYPLQEDERKLFLILVNLPVKITFDKGEYEMCQFIEKELESLRKTELLTSPYYFKDVEQN